MSDTTVPEFPGRDLKWALRFNDALYFGSREEVKAAWQQCRVNNIPAAMLSHTANMWQLTVPVGHVERIAKLPAITKEEAQAQLIASMADTEQEIATY